MEFRTDPVFEALQSPLALVEDQERRQTFERYVEAARFPLERSVFDLLSGLVEGVNEQVSDHYHLRLSYRPGALQLDVDPVAGESRAEADEPEMDFSDGETEKITIRIPAELKDLVTQAANSAGVSANSWFVKAMARAVRAMDDTERRDQRRDEHRRRHEIRIEHVRDRMGKLHDHLEDLGERMSDFDPMADFDPFEGGPRPGPSGKPRDGKRLQGWFGGES